MTIKVPPTGARVAAIPCLHPDALGTPSFAPGSSAGRARIDLLRHAVAGRQHASGSLHHPSRRRQLRAEMELRLLHAITRELGAATDFVAALRLVMARVCRAARWPLGQAWIPSAGGTVLEWAAAAGDGDPAVEPFLAASRGRVFGPGDALPGACWQLLRPVWMGSLADVAAFPRAAAAAAGLTAALAAPGLPRRQVLAVVKFFVAEARASDEHALGLVQTIAAQRGWPGPPPASAGA